MPQVLIGGDARGADRIQRWLAAWGLQAEQLACDEHPASVPRDRARAVLFACGSVIDLAEPDAVHGVTAPLILVGRQPAGALDTLAWDRVTDPGPGGECLAEALRPCLDSTPAAGCGNPGFRDFLNHELRTPLTAAGMALQTLALHLESAGGPSLDLVDTALRNIRRLEQTVEWATDYVVEDQDTALEMVEPACLTDLLEDLDDLDPGLNLTWATGVGDWQSPVSVTRDSWRRLLRQVLRALAYHQASRSVHLDLSMVGDGSGLLLVFQLPFGAERGDLARDEEEQLRRLLGFTIHPELNRRLQLRFDVVRTAENLRLRLLLPLEQPMVAAALQPA